LKKLLLLLFTLFLLINFINPVLAVSYGRAFKYSDHGYIYTGVKYPLDISRSINFIDPDNCFVPVTSFEKNKRQNLLFLKSGKASVINIMKLVQWGDAGVYQAAMNGKITKVYYIEVNRKKLFIPYTKFPIYISKDITTVYGE
jgi:hypothetical protein